jgi:hypothetical protein
MFVRLVVRPFKLYEKRPATRYPEDTVRPALVPELLGLDGRNAEIVEGSVRHPLLYLLPLAAH